jgi:hypothetical protein
MQLTAVILTTWRLSLRGLLFQDNLSRKVCETISTDKRWVWWCISLIPAMVRRVK